MNDKIKEKLANLRQWFLLLILAVFGIAGWIFTNEVITIKTYIAYISGLFFLVMALVFQIKIIKNINKIKNGNNNNS